MPKKKDETKKKYRAIFISGEENGIDDMNCMLCDNMFLIQTSVFKEEDQIKIRESELEQTRLSYNPKTSDISMCGVVYLCKLEDGEEFDEDDEIIEFENALIGI